MEIKLITEAAPDGEKLNIREGMTLEDLVGEQGPFEYDILLARVNGIDTELTAKLNEGDTVKLLDMRNQSANIAYQRGVTFIYLIAVREVFRQIGIEGADAEIDNSLNKGFFTRVRPARGQGKDVQNEIQELLSEDIVSRIETRMHELVMMDLPIRKSLVSMEEGIRIWNDGNYDEKVKLLKEVSDPAFMPAFYTIDVPSEGRPESYINYFFGPMVPSTGYIKRFELRKYHKGILLRYPYYSSPDKIP